MLIGFLTITAVSFTAIMIKINSKPGNIEENRFLLDTVVSMTLYQSQNKELLENTFEKIAEWENLLSRYRPESDISRINSAEANTALEISLPTRQVLQTALHYAEESSGAFDPSIGPLVSLWDIGTEHPRIPDSGEIASALRLVNYREVQLDTDGVTLKQPGMSLDIGGIAKGWIADEAARYLRDNGARHFLINLGGNILVSGGKQDGKPFRIGMQNPFGERGTYLGIFTLHSGSVVTSGIYERYFEIEGKRYHHILDTQTGYPAEKGFAAVTIISEHSTEGDALSTALFAMGQEGIDKALSLPGIEAAFVTSQGKILITPGAAAIFTPENDSTPMEILADHKE
ncbi:MAG: hypothetical protein B0D92_04655 [Spirochaeta sp. LUC14_002_19_P3]|nr:MAG: hypothetical protein B0D92_04655 [Spirochaeta sp. LUC14_002_19_P3]